MRDYLVTTLRLGRPHNRIVVRAEDPESAAGRAEELLPDIGFVYDWYKVENF